MLQILIKKRIFKIKHYGTFAYIFAKKLMKIWYCANISIHLQSEAISKQWVKCKIPNSTR